MKTRDQRPAKAYAFLHECLDRDRAFTAEELCKASGWSRETCGAYLSKKLEEFVYAAEDGYRVAPRFRRVRTDEFLDLFEQKRRLFASYGRHLYPHVIVYEFFLPLSHEQQLREALDDLFYADGLRQRLEEIGLDRIEEAFPRSEGETDEQLLERVTARAGDVFGGYSVHHVSGRFRAASLMSYEEAAGAQSRREEPYLIDETTAVVRFIAPFGAEARREAQAELPGASDDCPEREAEEIRWLFLEVFAGAVTRQVRGEDEIWLLESGDRTGLYIWSSGG